MRSSILFIFSLLSIINVSCFAMEENRMKEEKTKDLFDNKPSFEQYYKLLSSFSENINMLLGEYTRLDEDKNYKINSNIPFYYSRISVRLSEIKHTILCMEQNLSPQNDFRSYYISTIIKKINNVDNPLRNPILLNEISKNIHKIARFSIKLNNSSLDKFIPNTPEWKERFLEISNQELLEDQELSEVFQQRKMKQENRKLKNEQLQQIKNEYKELCEKNSELKKELEKTKLDKIAVEFSQEKISEKLKITEDNLQNIKEALKRIDQLARQAQQKITFYKRIVIGLAGLVMFLSYYFNLPAKCIPLFNQV